MPHFSLNLVDQSAGRVGTDPFACILSINCCTVFVGSPYLATRFSFKKLLLINHIFLLLKLLKVAYFQIVRAEVNPTDTVAK